MTSIDDQGGNSSVGQAAESDIDISAETTGGEEAASTTAASAGAATTSMAGSMGSEAEPQKRHIEKSFFFSVEDVQYNRDVSPMVPFPNNSTSERSSTPTHILTVTGAKGAWTQSNRDMAFSLYDSW